MGTFRWERMTEGKLGLILMNTAMLSKSLIQFSVDEWGCVTSLYFVLRPNCGRGNGDHGDLLQKDLCQDCCIQCLWPHSRSLLTHASARDIWTLTGKFGSDSCGGHCSFLLDPGMHKVLFLPSKSLFPQSCGSLESNPTGLQSQIPWGFSSPFAGSPGWEMLWALELSQQRNNFFGIIWYNISQCVLLIAVQLLWLLLIVFWDGFLVKRKELIVKCLSERVNS